MAEVFDSKIFYILLTMGIFFISNILYVRTSVFLLHPVLVTVAALIAYISFNNIDYAVYSDKSEFITFFLEPSVVALGLPLYTQLERVKKKFRAVAASIIAGSLSGIGSVAFIAVLLGSTDKIILSLAPKSVTTPIAMGVSEVIGGIPPLTAAFVVSVGILGAAIGLPFMKLAGIRNPEAVGIAMGTAAHAVGTSRVTVLGDNYGAFSGLGLALNGVVTALAAPWVMKLFI